MTNLKTLQEASKELGVSTDKARYWLGLLEVPTEKKGRVVYLPQESATKLAEMARLVSEGFAPSEAAKRARDVAVMVPVKFTPTVAAVDLMPMTARLESLEKAIMLIAESNKAILEENRRLADDVRAFRMENALLRRMIEAPKSSPVVEKKEVIAEPQPVVRAKPQGENFTDALKSVQDWIRGICSPFVEALRGA